MDILQFENMDFNQLERLIGSNKFRFLYEYNQNKKMYIFSAIVFALAIACALFGRFFDNPLLTSFFLLWLCLFILISYGIKKSSIKDAPSNKKIIEYLENENKLSDFINHLEQKMTPYYWCQLLRNSFLEKWTFNILFSGIFAISIIIYTKLNNHVPEYVSELTGSFWTIVIYLYTSFGLVVYSWFKQKDEEVTLSALQYINKYDANKTLKTDKRQRGESKY